MTVLPESLRGHRVAAADEESVCAGTVRWAPVKSLWLSAMSIGAGAGGIATVSLPSLLVFVASTAFVLLFGHSLGSHRLLIHRSYTCPRWLDYALVHAGVLVGLAGPLGLLRQHELRDFAQRMPRCHPYLRHGNSFWRDGLWQLHCELVLDRPPRIEIEPATAQDPYYRFLERTWMAQQLPVALLMYAAGGWAFVFWGVCARVTAGVIGHWWVGWFAHNRGEMHAVVENAAVQGRNVRRLALVTMGESWHNNHHAYPGSARLGLYPGEWDPGWWALLAMSRLGLVEGLRTPADLAPRPELKLLDLGPAGFDARPTLPLRVAMSWATRPLDTVPVRLLTPGAHVSATVLRELLGGSAEVETTPSARRLALSVDNGWLIGLPAVAMALARSSRTGRALSPALLAVAFGIEAIRRWSEQEPAGRASS